MKSAYELFGEKEHGTRYRYLGGCKCFYCRRANSDYERERKVARTNGDWNGIVDAAAARAHINMLSAEGVGRRTLAARSGVAETVIREIKNGCKTRVRARTERKLFTIVAIHQHGSTLVDASGAWQLIRELLAEGFTKTRIAKELGYSRALQLNKHRITAKNDRKVRELYRKYMYMN